MVHWSGVLFSQPSYIWRGKEREDGRQAVSRLRLLFLSSRSINISEPEEFAPSLTRAYSSRRKTGVSALLFGEESDVKPCHGQGKLQLPRAPFHTGVSWGLQPPALPVSSLFQQPLAPFDIVHRHFGALTGSNKLGA